MLRLVVFFQIILLKTLAGAFEADIFVDQNGEFRCPDDPITGRYPDPSDRHCTYFFLCHRGRAFPMECDLRTAFHPDLGECISRDRVPEDLCPPIVNCKVNGYVADPTDCTMFYLCFYKNAIHYGCERNFVFDKKKVKCVYNKREFAKCARVKPKRHPLVESYTGKPITKPPQIKIPVKVHDPKPIFKQDGSRSSPIKPIAKPKEKEKEKA